MSDTLADLASWLPSEFLADDDLLLRDKENFFNLNRNALNDFASSSSTESESDDDDISALNRRFHRSTSLQQPRRIPYTVEKKRVFSGSPQSTLGWSISSRSQVPSPPSQLNQANGDSWDLIYAAAGQVARIKMGTSNYTGNGDNRGLLGTPHHLGLPHSHQHPHCPLWGEREDLLARQQQPSGGGSYRSGGGGRPMVVPQSAWPPLHRPTYGRQPVNGSVMKPVFHRDLGGGCNRDAFAVKKECAGTGVFLPRRYSNDPPETRKRQGCSPAAHVPARVHFSNKNFDSVAAKAKPNINGGFVPRYEMMIARRNAMMLSGQQRRSNGMPEAAAQMAHPEVMLPQEWTY